jgi:hypothetical protein
MCLEVIVLRFMTCVVSWTTKLYFSDLELLVELLNDRKRSAEDDLSDLSRELTEADNTEHPPPRRKFRGNVEEYLTGRMQGNGSSIVKVLVYYLLD